MWISREAASQIVIPEGLTVTYAEVADLARLVPSDAPHQGIVADVDPLDDIWLGDLLTMGADDSRPLLVLDQITDPHNVGAILRSAAAFDALDPDDTLARGEVGQTGSSATATRRPSDRSTL